MEANNFSNYLKKYANKINQELEVLFADWIKECTQESKKLQPLVEALHEQTKGGKRIRGTLIFLGYELASLQKKSSENEKSCSQVAVAYELLQTALLAHDDIIDKSE